MWIKFVLIIILSFAGGGVSAQHRFSLDDCIRYAIETNPELKNGALESRIKRNDYIAAIGEVLPEVKAETKFGKRYGRAVDPGTNLFATNDFIEGSLNLSISVPLFEGFTRVNKIRFQRLSKQLSDWTLAYRKNEIAFEVMDAFYQVLFCRQLWELSVEQRQLSGHYLQQAEEFVKEGLRAEVDLQEVRSRVSADVYQERVRNNALQMALLGLKELIWLPVEDSLQIILPGDSIISPQLFSARALYDESVQFLPQFRLMELRLKASQRSLAMAGGRFSPSVRGEAGFYSGYYDTERDEQGNVISYGRQLDNNLNKYFGVTVSLPLLGGFKNLTGVRKARLQLDQTRNEVQLEQRKVFSEIENACLSLRAAVEEVRAAEEVHRAEKLTLQQAEEKWREGLIAVFELMESRNRYFTARSELVRTQLQYGIKKRTIDFYGGEPLVKTGNGK